MSILPAPGATKVLMNRPSRWTWNDANPTLRRLVIRLVVIRHADDQLEARVYGDELGQAVLHESRAAAAVTSNSVTLADGEVWRVNQPSCGCKVPRSLKNFRVPNA